MNNIETVIRFVKQQVKAQLDLDLTFRELKSVDFFPRNDIYQRKGRDVYEITYNRDLEVLLWLYNLVFRENAVSSSVITHFILFYACLDKEQYDSAVQHLQFVETELSKVKQGEDMNAHLSNQLAFIMLHEIYHVIFKYKPDTKELGLQSERERQSEIKDEMAELLKTITPEEIFEMPRTQPRIEALLASFVPKSIKKAIVREIIEKLVRPEDYEKIVLGDDIRLIEEMTCDRSAWQFLMEVCKSVGESKEEMFDMHCSLFVALTAMFVNENFHAYCFPEKQEKSLYDAKTTIIRQNSFKRLDMFIPVDYTNEVSKRYIDVTEHIERVCQETRNSFVEYAKDLASIYDDSSKKEMNEEKRSELIEKMEKVVDSVMETGSNQMVGSTRICVGSNQLPSSEWLAR